MKTIKTDVLIVGGGPTGMTAALCLAAAGVKSIIVERYKEPLEHPKAHELSARSLEILHSVGFSRQELLHEASDHETASRILFCDQINTEYGRIDLRQNELANKYKTHLADSRSYLNISQTELEKIMRRKVTACPATDFLLEHEWLSMQEDADGITSVVKDTTSTVENSLQINSCYMICADGAMSNTREFLGIKMQGPEKIQDFVNAYFTNDLSVYVKTKAKLYFILNPEAAGVFIAHHPKKRWVYHVPIETPFEKVADFTKEIFTARIRKALGAPDLDINIKSIKAWRMTAQTAQTFRRGSAFLAGDAAHRFPPTGGLGLNSGIGDVHNLAWKLAAVLKNKAPEELLDTYESERRPVIKRNCEESRINFERLNEIPQAMGINPVGRVWLARVLTFRFIRFLPNRVLVVFKSIVNRMARSVMRRALQPGRVRDRVIGAIKNQIPHFDRIGLDLGYTYNQGAIIPSEADREKVLATGQSYHVSHYQPSTEPGVRFPHFTTSDGRSSHELLAYQKFALIVAGPTQDWQQARVAMRHRSALKIRRLPRSIDSNSFRPVPGEVVLVRPDGTVAWRYHKPQKKIAAGKLATMLDQALDRILQYHGAHNEK